MCHQNLKFILASAMCAFLAACSSSEKKIETVDTKLGDTQKVSSSENIGMRGENEAVYQKKTDLVNELVKIQDEVYALQDKVYGTPDYDSKGLYGKALACRKAKAMKTGELTFVPDKSPVIEDDQMTVARDAQTKKLIGYQEEDLQKRLTRFKDYKATLFSRQDQLEQYIDKCEVDMKK